MKVKRAKNGRPYVVTSEGARFITEAQARASSKGKGSKGSKRASSKRKSSKRSRR